MDRIIQALEPFELPIYYAEVPEDQLDNMNFFYYRETQLSRSGSAHFLQTLEVAYVSQNQDDLMEEDIIDSLEKNGLKFQSASYNRVQMVKTSEFVDIVIFTVTRPWRRKRCM